MRAGRPIRAAVAAAATLAVILGAASPGAAERKSIRLASTTSTDNSSLFAHLLPIFDPETGIKVHVIAVGTGQAIEIARNGDADVLLVHHRPSEERFVGEGYGLDRRDVMYNDFVIVGPRSGSAAIHGRKDAVAAFRKIAGAKALFASRGDDSGTHKAERQLRWDAGVDVAALSGTWYRETGSGMGAVLNVAAAMSVYTLSDRGTWLSFENKRALVIHVQGDRRLFNQYGVIVVNPARHPHVKTAESEVFVDWLTSPPGQEAIANFQVNGQQLFFPNAGEPRS